MGPRVGNAFWTKGYQLGLLVTLFGPNEISWGVVNAFWTKGGELGPCVGSAFWTKGDQLGR